MDAYERYEADCKKIRKTNRRLLAEFETWLESAVMADKTIRNHLFNVDFYINEFLLYEDAIEAKDGVSEISMFLGYWFIKKAMWSSPASIKSNAASLKKFYAFLLEKGLIRDKDLNELTATIKDEMPEWIATLKRYDDPSIESMEDVWGY